MERLSTAKVVNLFFMGIEKRSHTFQPAKDTRITRYFQLINASKVNTEEYCRLTIEKSILSSNHFIYSLHEKLGYDYRLDFNKIFSTTGWRITLEKPNTDISKIGFEIIDRVDFYYGDYHDLYFQKNFHYLAFAYILENCSNLDHFELQHDNKTYPTIIACRRVEANTWSSPSSMQENIKVVKLAHVDNLQLIITLVASHLPGIEILSCTSTHFAEKSTDLTVFPNLECFFFNPEPGLDEDIRFLIIEFDCGDEKKYFCYCLFMGKAFIIENIEKYNFDKDNVKKIKFKISKNVKVF